MKSLKNMLNFFIEDVAFLCVKEEELKPTSQYVVCLEEGSSNGVSKVFFYSLVLQIVAGADYRIVAGTMGYAGNSHDSTIMKKPSFWKNRENIFTPGARVIEGVEVPYLETGDSGSPMTRSMKPYTHN